MIKNGKNVPLNQSSGTVPNMGSVIVGWFQAMTFVVVTKSQVNFETKETVSTVTFKGVIQPYTPEQLSIRPEGERTWKWYKIHADTSLKLITDDKVTYLGVNYRVMSRSDFSLYGYIEYDVIEDYT